MKKRFVLGSILVLALATFILRIYFVFHMQEASGGDVYEFLLIARRLVHLHNPFSEVKRLPGFPIFLIPSEIFKIDGVLWARLVSAFFASVSIPYIFLIAKKLKLSDALSLLSAFMYATNQVVFIFSVRPLAYSLYSFILILAIYIYFWLSDKESLLAYVALGGALGFLTMIRHEGFLIAFLYLAYLFLEKPKRVWKILISGILITLIAFPFLLNNYLAFGNPFKISYLGQGGLYQPDSVKGFANNFEAIYLSLSSMWGRVFIKYNDLIKFTGYLILTFLALKIAAKDNKYIKNYFSLIWVLIFGLLVNVLNFSGGIIKNLPLLIFVAGICGTWYFLKLGKAAFLIALLIFTHLVIAFWFQPSSRYLQQFIAFFSIFASLGLFQNISRFWEKALAFGLSLLLLFPFSEAVRAKVRENAVDTKVQHSFTDAIKFLKNTDGFIGLEPDTDYTRSYIALYYLGADRVLFLGSDYLGRGPMPSNSVEVYKWIQDNKIRYLVDHLPDPVFSAELLLENTKINLNKVYGSDSEDGTLVYEIK